MCVCVCVCVCVLVKNNVRLNIFINVHLLVYHITMKYYVVYYFGELVRNSDGSNEVMILPILSPTPYGLTALVGISPLIVEVSRSHSDTPHLVGHEWTREWALAGTSL
jgi:hypothetical protein